MARENPDVRVYLAVSAITRPDIRFLCCKDYDKPLRMPSWWLCPFEKTIDVADEIYNHATGCSARPWIILGPVGFIDYTDEEEDLIIVYNATIPEAVPLRSSYVWATFEEMAVDQKTKGLFSYAFGYR